MRKLPASPPAPATFDMSGTIEPYAEKYPGNPGPTKKSNGRWELNMPEYGDPCTADLTVQSGDQVTVTDPAGTVIGVGQIQPGVYASDSTAHFCRFAFTVPGVPEGSTFYGIQMGQHAVVQLPRGGAERIALTVDGSAHGKRL